jgi:hypothetical protein
MSRSWKLAAVALLAGCGGTTKAVGPPAGPPEGTCSSDGSAWSCVANDAGATQDGGGAIFLGHCPSGVGSGSCTGGDQLVDTTNPLQPAHIANGDCLQCASNGVGTYWSCVSGSWQAQGVYSCQ